MVEKDEFWQILKNGKIKHNDKKFILQYLTEKGLINE